MDFSKWNVNTSRIKPISWHYQSCIGNWEGIHLMKRMCCSVRVQGWGNTEIYLFICQAKKQHWCLNSLRSNSFCLEICQLSRLTSSHACVCVCVQGSSHGVDFYEAKPVVYCEIHSNEPFPTVLKISDAAFGNEMHPISPLIPFEWWIPPVLQTIINLIVSCSNVAGRGLQQLNLLLFPNQLDLWNPFLFACLQ